MGYSSGLSEEELGVEREAIFDPQKRWVTSRANLLEVVRGHLKLPKRVLIKDDTLRSGCNTPGVALSLEQKLTVARALEEAGVEEIEAGYPGVDEDCAFMKRLKEEGTRLRLAAHTRLWVDYREEIDRALGAGADVINLYCGSGPIGEASLNPQLPTTAIPDRAQAAIEYAKSSGAKLVAFGMTAHPLLEWYERSYRAAAEAGADRVVIYDGKGWLSPEAVAFFVRLTRDAVGQEVKIGIHCHDDMGLACANSLEAVKAGAEVVDVVVNGLGHRCGNAALEEVVLALESIYGVATGIRLERLMELSRVVERTFGIPIPPNKPHVGSNVYQHGGLHVSAILKGQWYVWENIRAEAIGARRGLQFGPTTLQKGPFSPIPLKAESMGLRCSDEELEEVFRRLRRVIEEKKYADEEEVERIIREVVKGRGEGGGG